MQLTHRHTYVHTHLLSLISYDYLTVAVFPVHQCWYEHLTVCYTCTIVFKNYSRVYVCVRSDYHWRCTMISGVNYIEIWKNGSQVKRTTTIDDLRFRGSCTMFIARRAACYWPNHPRFTPTHPIIRSTAAQLRGGCNDYDRRLQ